jgi:hypothetical protein
MFDAEGKPIFPSAVFAERGHGAEPEAVIDSRNYCRPAEMIAGGTFHVLDCHKAQNMKFFQKYTPYLLSAFHSLRSAAAF